MRLFNRNAHSADYATIAKSKYFNKRWYLKTYPDVAAAKIDPIQHFLEYGWKENRNPSRLFDVRKYLNTYPDVQEGKMNPLLHYEKFGKKEKRKIELAPKSIDLPKIIDKSKYFDKKWYLKTYEDVAKAKIDPIVHYLQTGWKENRNPSPLFDSDGYLVLNPDVKESGMNPLIHYLLYGKKEKRAFVSVLTEKLEEEYLNQIKNSISCMKSSSKKIVLISHELTNTGAPYALLSIAKILKESGYEILVLSPMKGLLAKSFKKIGVPCLIIPHLLDLNVSFYVEAFQGLDFALCNTVRLTKLSAKLQNVLPTLLYIHEAEEGVRNQRTKEYFIDKINYLKHVQQIACVSPFAKSFYEPYAKNIGIIHNSVVVDVDFFTKKHKNLRFAYVGAVTDENKNVSLFVNAFQKLYEQYRNIELHLIGRDDTDLGKQLKKQKLKKVFFHGCVVGKEKDKIFDAMDVFVIPSHSESCSLVALEAAAHMKAIILTENVGAKYMFENERSALICKVDDEKSLYESMRKLYEDEVLKENISKNAYASYLRDGTPSVTRKDILSQIRITIENFNQKIKINDLTIIIPVYNAADKVDECIQSVIKNTKLSEHINVLIMDDCSPEPSVAEMLKKYKNVDFVTVIRNPQNLGYTFNINKAIKLAKGRDVILLNSDTIVTKNWVEKIQKIAYLSPNIGTVTPVSNSAGAFSVPESGTNVIPADLNVEKMAKIVSECGKDKFFEVPTGNGFCLFIKGQVIEEVGLFDEKNFPRGYGEENDYSMRVKQHGFLNVVILDTYIFHHEHASFKETSLRLMEKSAQIINALYPTYKNEISVFSKNSTFNYVKQKIKTKMGIK